MTTVPMITLNNGVQMPQLGFGVFQVPDDETQAAVTAALDAGYRSIDTAAVYGNERGVGQAIADSQIARDELFITSKVWNSDQGFDETLAAYDKSLELLGLDHLDLYLIHWPTPARDKFVDTWKAMEKLLADGRVRSIGVSNFQTDHLQRLFDETSVVPAVNQIELHPALQNRVVAAFDAEHGIATEAWSPLARGGELLENPVITEIAAAQGATPAQVILAWHLAQGRIVIPKSVTPSRIAENFASVGVKLTENQLAAIDGLEDGVRVGPDPDEFNNA